MAGRRGGDELAKRAIEERLPHVENSAEALARVEQRPDSAAVHYRWVLDAWKDADPQFYARRDSVAARLAAVTQPR